MSRLKISLRLNGKRRLVLPLFILLLAGAIGGLGSIRYPYGELRGRAPVVPPGVAESSKVDRFRVASFNIHSGRGADGNFDLSRIAKELSGTDLVGLNEVRGRSFLSEKDQAAQLGEKLNMAAIFGPSERRWFISSFGNGLLSRFPILSWRSQPMRAGRSGSYRAVILARVKVGEQAIEVIVAHADRGAMRDAQLLELRGLFDRAAAPAILMGDLNAELSHPELRQMKNIPEVLHVLSPDSSASTKQIDHIYIRGLHLLAAGVSANRASDHPIVWAEVKGSHRSMNRH